jgi:hypothetical protein
MGKHQEGYEEYGKHGSSAELKRQSKSTGPQAIPLNRRPEEQRPPVQPPCFGNPVKPGIRHDSVHRELCTTPLIVMPAQAGIQEVLEKTGFPLSRE